MPLEAPSLPIHPEPGREGGRDALVHELRFELLRRGGRCRGRLASGSMAPTIALGDEVVVTPTARRLKPGDIVLFEREGTPTVHRLIRAAHGQRRWIEKGDLNERGAVIDEADVAGQVVLIEKPGGSIDLTTVRARCAGRVIALLAGLALPRHRDGAPRGGRLPRAALRAAGCVADVFARGAVRPGETG